MSTRFSKKEIQKGRKMRTTSDRVEPFPPNCAAPRCFHSLFLFAQPSRADRRQWSFIRAGEREVAVGFYCATSASTPRGRRRLYFHHNSSYQLHGRVVLLFCCCSSSTCNDAFFTISPKHFQCIPVSLQYIGLTAVFSLGSNADEGTVNRPKINTFIYAAVRNISRNMSVNSK